MELGEPLYNQVGTIAKCHLADAHLQYHTLPSAASISHKAQELENGLQSTAEVKGDVTAQQSRHSSLYVQPCMVVSYMRTNNKHHLAGHTRY